jgi:hypothetical protein
VLHIRSGDDILPKLKEAGLPGEFIKWADPLCQGPAPAGLSSEAWRAVRTNFISDQFGIPFPEAFSDYAKMDRELERFHDHEAVVLWFEHDLFCQTILIYLLDWFSRKELKQTKLFLICSGEFLGRMSGERLAALFGTEREITSTELALGRKGWRAFCASDPSGLEALARGETGPLPFLRQALLRHLQQFPSTRNGLGRTEQLGLEAIGAGKNGLNEIFCEFQKRDPDSGWTDAMLWNDLKGLTRGETPLLATGGSGDWPCRENSSSDLTLHLTPKGEALLRGEADWIRLNGADRWVGGVHLAGADASWRWDEGAQRLVHSLPIFI